MVEYGPTGQPELESPSTITLSPKIHNRLQRMLTLTLKDSRERSVDFYRFGDQWTEVDRFRGSPLKFSKKRGLLSGLIPRNPIPRTLARLESRFRLSRSDRVHRYKSDEIIVAHTHPVFTAKILRDWWETKTDMENLEGIDEQAFNEVSDIVNRNMSSTPSGGDIRGDFKRAILECLIYKKIKYSSIVIGATGMTLVCYRSPSDTLATGTIDTLLSFLDDYEEFRGRGPYEVFSSSRLTGNTREHISSLLSEILRGQADVYFSPDPANPILTRVSE